MTRLSIWMRRNKFILLVLAIYLTGTILMFGQFRHVLNPDGVSYISIAEKYAQGDFQNALNGYWGPLLSWLIAPFIFLQRDPQAAAKLVTIFAGALVLVLLWKLSGMWRVHVRLRRLLLVAIVPLVWLWTMPAPITPDLLVVVVVLLYVYALGRSPVVSRQGAIVVGLIAAAGFYTKSFLLPFFVTHLSVYGLLAYVRIPTKRKAILRDYGLAIGVTALLVAPWCIALSIKYDKPTVSTAGGYNLAVQGPERKGLHPMEDQGLLAPSNATAVSIWEDPSYIEVRGWSPLEYSHYFVNYVQENLRAIGSIFLAFSVFSLALVALGVIGLLRRPYVRQWHEQLLVVSVVIIYATGYSVLPREERYMWPVFVLLLLLGALLANRYKLYKLSASNGLLIFLVMLSVMYAPLDRLLHSPDSGLSFKQGAAVMKPFFTGEERVASDTFDAMRYCYYIEVTCFSKINPSLDDATNEAQLVKNRISDIIIYDTSAEWHKPAYLREYTEVPTGNSAIRLLRRAD